MSAARTLRRALATVVVGGAALAAAAGPAGAATSGPTCSDKLPIAVHGQHIVGDYVTGLGMEGISWPASGGVVGQAVSAAGGAVVKGGPGPGFHFPNGFAPGASFCNASRSPGTHL